jgi:hypothetical protein
LVERLQWNTMTDSKPRLKSSAMSRASARELPVAIPGMPVATRLLDRQVRLLDYLTSRGAIFGEGTDALRDAVLHGIDPRLLCLQARFSYHKRIEKISAALPRTLRTLGARRAAIVREFVEACPPTEIKSRRSRRTCRMCRPANLPWPGCAASAARRSLGLQMAMGCHGRSSAVWCRSRSTRLRCEEAVSDGDR